MLNLTTEVNNLRKINFFSWVKSFVIIPFTMVVYNYFIL